jgi:hypothetical protein
MNDTWRAHVLDHGEPGWHEVTETGWDALKLWCAGPDNRSRVPRYGVRSPVIVTVEQGGTASRFETPFTAYDLDAVESSIDEVLKDAGIPPLPRGFRWFVRIPAGWSGDDFMEHIDSLLNAAVSGSSPGPRDWLEGLKPIMRDVYRSS